MAIDPSREGWITITLSISSSVSNHWKLTIRFEAPSLTLTHEDNFEVEAPAPSLEVNSWPGALSWPRNERQAADNIQRFGCRLWEIISASKVRALSPQAQRAFESLLDSAAANGHYLLFLINLFTADTWTNSPIHSYPWEIMYWKGSELLRYHPVVHLVECSPTADTQELQRTQPPRALIVVVNADAEGDPRFTDHERSIHEQFEQLGYKVEPLLLASPTAAAVTECLRTRSYDVLYFACHGEADPEIPSGRLKLANRTSLTGEDLRLALLPKHTRSPLSMVVLCACESAAAPEGASRFAMAPFLVHSRLARQAMGFLAPVGIPFALDFGLELLTQKAYGVSWASAYFRARSRKNTDESYWPLARFFVASSRPELLKFESLDPPLPPPPSSTDEVDFSHKSEEAGLRDWLRRPEDPALVFVTGPSKSGNTALVLRSIRPPSGSAAFTRLQGMVWLDTANLGIKHTDKETVIVQTIRESMLTAKPAEKIKGERSAKAAEVGESSAPAPLLPFSSTATEPVDRFKNGAGVLILDGWPSDVEFPDLSLGQRWKVLVTTHRLPRVKENQRFLELVLG